MSRVFVITGSRKGIGRQLAFHYAEQGNIVIGCSRREVDFVHHNYSHYQLDVVDEKAVRRMIREVSKTHGRIDVLLNNAGVASMNLILSTPLKTVEHIYATNVFGTFLFMREVAKVMMNLRSGSIVNFATVATPLRLEGEAIYASSKAALINLTEIAARELAVFGIRVNAIGPTPVKTDLIKNVPENKIDALIERQAIKRFGEIKDIINVIDFFIDERSSFITGQVIFLGGISG